MHADASLTNKDLAPVGPDQRTWTRWDIAALWVGMAVCIPTYTMASSLIGNGMTWWQALLTVFLGNLIVLIPPQSTPALSSLALASRRRSSPAFCYFG